MKNYKNLIKVLFVCASLVLTGCSGKSKKSKSDDFSAEVFFQNLQIEEQQLNQNYGFYSVLYNDGRIRYGNVLNRKHLRLISRVTGKSVKAVKANFFDDIYNFTSKHHEMRSQQHKLEDYNAELYFEYSIKLFRLGEFFNAKRDRFYERNNGHRRDRGFENDRRRKDRDFPEVVVPDHEKPNKDKKKKPKKKKEIIEEDSGKRPLREDEKLDLEDSLDDEDFGELPPPPGDVNTF